MFNYYLLLAIKSLKKTPVTTVLMVAAIALGIGISMNALTLNHMRSMNPIPEKTDQLFSLQLQSMGKGNNSSTPDGMPYQITYQDAVNLQRQGSPLRHTAMVRTGFAVNSDDPEFLPLLQSARAIQSDFFAMFNVPFKYGNAWDKSIDENPANLVVIGEELNQRVFGGGNNVGKNIYLNQIPYRITGITDHWSPVPKFYDLNNGAFNDAELIFLPFSLLPVHEIGSWGNNNGWKEEKIDGYKGKLQSEVMWIQYWVELPDSEAKEAYDTFLASYVEQQKKLGRFEHENAKGSIKDVQQWLDYNNVVGDDSNILVGISFMFLSVCLVNTVGLLLAKFLKRAPEIGVRRALGANRFQVFIQHLVEVGVLGFIGGLFGLVLANIGLFWLKTEYSQYDVLATMDLQMYLAAPVIAVTATVVAGLYPAWRVCTTLPSIYLKTQ